MQLRLALAARSESFMLNLESRPLGRPDIALPLYLRGGGGGGATLSCAAAAARVGKHNHSAATISTGANRYERRAL